MSLYTNLDSNEDGTFTARVVDTDTKQEVLRYVTSSLPRRELEALTLQKIEERDNPPVRPVEPAPTPEQLATKAYMEDLALARRLQRMEALGVTVGGDLATVQKRLNDNFRPEYGVFF